MAVLQALLNVIVPVLVIAGAGVVLGRSFRLDADTIGKIGLHALTPALCLQTMLTTKVSGRLGLVLVGAFLVVTLLACIIGALGAIGLPRSTRGAMMASVAITNSGNMGLPIALFALGQAGLEQSLLIFLASVVLSFIIGPLLFGSDKGAKAAVLGLVKLPALWAMLLGIGMRLAGVQFPLGVSRGLEMLSNACLPMILLSLGIQLGSSRALHLTRAVLVGSVARVAVMPVVSLGVGLLFGLHGVPLQALVLAGAMPTAVNAFLLALEFKGDVQTVADTVTLTTLLSIASAAVVTALLPWVGTL